MPKSHPPYPSEFRQHRDQGSQYTSVAFGQRCEKLRVRPSMGSVGDAYDNAMAESFFASLECELIDRRSFETKSQARLALSTYIEGWYNPRRRHSALAGYHRPTSNGNAFNVRSQKPSQKCPNPLEVQAATRPRNRGNSSFVTRR